MIQMRLVMVTFRSGIKTYDAPNPDTGLAPAIQGAGPPIRIEATFAGPVGGLGVVGFKPGFHPAAER